MPLIKRIYTDNETVITAQNLNDIQDAILALEDGLFTVESDKSGEVINITDASKRGFRSFSVYGKTTQAGTPTPDNPVALDVVGDSGSITVNVAGANETKSITIATPNGLPGIPVASGGNYTDANGQQWVCDEIDLARGVYIQRISTVVLDGSADELWAFGTSYGLYQHYIAIQGAKANSDVLNSAFQSKNRTIEDGYSFVGTIGRLSCFSSTINTADSWRAYLATTPITVYYILADPIMEALPDESVTAYASLRTYRGNTTISNDAGAYMDLEYVMDAKKYIDSLVISSGGAVAKISSVTLLASAWTGSGTLYSQVVSIAGITENSQVNLTPTVSQMSAFYDKDISFVTENDGGTVTVYVIGQKPTNDYTIPANIVEVRV